MAAQTVIGRQKAPGLGVPVNTCTAHAVTGEKADPVADRKRRLARIVAERQRFLIWPQKQIVSNGIAKLILSIGWRKICRRVSPGTALDRHDIKTSLCQLVGENGPSPSETDNRHFLRGKFTRHSYFTSHSDRPRMLTGGKG
jgi:hypothetical protein